MHGYGRALFDWGGYYEGLWENNKWKLVSSMLNLLIIVIAGAIYEYLAYHLTMWENHRTNTEFEDSIIMKNFLFQFINNYFILFYIAVIRPFYAPCQVLMTDGSAGNGEYYDVTRCRQSDLPEIQFQLIIVFTGKTLGWRAAELVQPKIKGMQATKEDDSRGRWARSDRP